MSISLQFWWFCRLGFSFPAFKIIKNEGIPNATRSKGAQTKQINPTTERTAMPTFGVAGRMLKRPHSINDKRQEAGRHLVFFLQTNKTSSDPSAQMFGGGGGLLILDKCLTKKSVSVSAWFEGFPLNWINIPNRNSPRWETGLKRGVVRSELGRSWRFSQPDELNRLCEAAALYNAHTINLGIHTNHLAGESQSVSK